jgi:formamidopyrimidine-DNA glycosylase
MPELPEVETIVRDLRPHVAGRRIGGLTYVHWDKTFATGSPKRVGAALAGRRVAALERRAKRVVMILDDGRVFVVSLRMTGQLTWERTPRAPSSFTRFILALDKGAVRFDDARKFGRVWLYTPAQWAAESARLGPEPLSMSEADFAALLATRRGMLKALLLDQKTLAGVGNIYADEALWLAKLHPRKRAETLSRAQAGALYRGVREALEAGIRNKGTSIDDYVGGLGEQGDNQNHLHAYGRTGEPCERCGTPIKRITSGQRGTHFCPTCQRQPRIKNP